MADLYFDPEADRALTDLEDSEPDLAGRVHDVLELLEEDPTDVRLRRRRFQIGLWAVVVHLPEEDWVVLWEHHPDLEDAVIIHYIGSASFA